MEEWGEAYQAQSWGPLIELVKADLQPNARRDKARCCGRCLSSLTAPPQLPHMLRATLSPCALSHVLHINQMCALELEAPAC